MKNKLLKKEYRIYAKYILVVVAVLLCGIIYCGKRFWGKTAETNEYVIAIDNTAETNNSEYKESQISNVHMNSEDNCSKNSSEENGDTQIYVYVCGSVNEPGVYKCNKDSRLYELVDMAGGFSENADETYLNLVDKAVDGQKLYIPSITENLIDKTTESSSQSSLININTATKEQLMTLPGIGESKAADIITYRNTKGGFGTKEDIKNISGIKESAYTKIKDLICTG